MPGESLHFSASILVAFKPPGCSTFIFKVFAMNWKVSHVSGSQTAEHVCCVKSIVTSLDDIVLIGIGVFPKVIGNENPRVRSKNLS